MEDYNRSHRYRDDNRSSSNERNYDNNWDRTRNRSDDWGGYNTENRDTQYSDRERGYSSGGNQMNRNYYNDKFSSRGSYDTNDLNRNYWNDTDSKQNNFRGDYYNRNDYMRSNDYDRDNNWNNDNNRNRNERSNDRYNNYSEQDRNWWDRTKDEVASWFGDDDAQRRRHRDERYDEKHNGEHRGKGPKNYTRSQERIKEDVSDKLSDDSFLDASDIDVEVNGNEVTLNGHVDSRYSKHRAEDLAEDVTGVSHVQNNLRVWDNTSQTTNSNTNTQNTNANSSSNSNTTTGTGYNTTKNKKEHVTL